MPFGYRPIYYLKRPHKFIQDLWCEIDHLWFRLRRGFSYRDCWSLDYAMAEWLAPRLKHLADNHNGAPPCYPWTDEKRKQIADPSVDPDDINTDFDKWTEDLRRAGAAMAAYAESGGELFEKWYRSGQEDYYEHYMAEEKVVIEEAQEAMRWIAVNFRYLWD